MSKKTKKRSIIIFSLLAVLIFVGIVISGGTEKAETVQEMMKDAVLHESAKVSLFGIIDVNPGLIAAYTATAALILFALFVRIFKIPRFKKIPGKFQLILEQGVGLFRNLAKENSPHKNRFLGAYIFTAGIYIFFGTLLELFGIQAITTAGHPISLPAPLSDINGAIGLALFSYLVILIGGLINGGLKGMGNALKDFSLPISMSFRLFGALLSGALVTELVYYYVSISFVVPVIVGVAFTLIHAIIQAYVLTMLTSIFYGESSEPAHKKIKIGGSKNEKNN